MCADDEDSRVEEVYVRLTPRSTEAAALLDQNAPKANGAANGHANGNGVAH